MNTNFGLDTCSFLSSMVCVSWLQMSDARVAGKLEGLLSREQSGELKQLTLSHNANEDCLYMYIDSLEIFLFYSP